MYWRFVFGNSIIFFHFYYIFFVGFAGFFILHCCVWEVMCYGGVIKWRVMNLFHACDVNM